MLAFYLAMIDTQRDRDKFECLFHQYERCLKYTAQNILRDEHLAEDAVQETFIRIIGCLDKIDEADEHKTVSFLMTVIKNISYDIKRKQSKANTENSLEELLDLDADPEDRKSRPDTLLLHREETEMILDTIRCLPPDYRYVLSLKYAHGCGSAQIAALLDCSEELARVKLSRARKCLMNRLAHARAKENR